jgi:hypothetical protein
MAMFESNNSMTANSPLAQHKEFMEQMKRGESIYVPSRNLIGYAPCQGKRQNQHLVQEPRIGLLLV